MGQSKVSRHSHYRRRRKTDACQVVPYRNLIGERGDEAHATAAAGAKGAVNVKILARKTAHVPRCDRAWAETAAVGSMLVASTSGAGTMIAHAGVGRQDTMISNQVSRGSGTRAASFSISSKGKAADARYHPTTAS